jgi:hypothetical protein
MSITLTRRTTSGMAASSTSGCAGSSAFRFRFDAASMDGQPNNKLLIFHG